MCGRYVSPDTAAIERTWQITRLSGDPFPLRFNVAPTMAVPIIWRAAGGLEFTPARWGLVPSWWKQVKPPGNCFNARSEEAASKTMWRDAFRAARCLVPMLGWYEWQEFERVDGATGELKKFKQPHYFFVERDRPGAFAGLMSTWAAPGQAPVVTCAILTRPASPSAADIHDRMPVVLPIEAQAAWLDPAIVDAAQVAEIVRTAAASNVQHYPVSPRLNAAKNDDEDLINPIAEATP
jgi:putative SOS response-associated peptidase YedK